MADEPHIAEAFRIVLATIDADVLPAPPVHGRQTLKGRAEIRERAVELARTGLGVKSVARAVDPLSPSCFSPRPSGFRDDSRVPRGRAPELTLHVRLRQPFACGTLRAQSSTWQSLAMGFLKRLFGGAGSGSADPTTSDPADPSTSTRPSVPAILSWRAGSRTAWTN